MAVILKFGDALALAGHVPEARTQFELASRIAQRTRLTDLEQQAQRERPQWPG